MKFAFCLFKYFPFGGLQRDFFRIATACVQKGHSVDVYTMEWEGERSADFNIHILSITSKQNHTRMREFANQVQIQLENKSYDLVVGFNKMPGLDVYFAADTCYQEKARKKHGFLYRLTPRYRQLIAFENAVFCKAAHTDILVISKTQQPEFTHYYHTPAERFHWLPPGISRDRIAPENADEIRQQLRQEFQMNTDDFLILMVGSGFKTKGLDRVLIGFAALPEEIKHRAKLFIVGDDNPDIFKTQATQLKIADKTLFLGGRKDVVRFFLSADLLLHPAYNENTGTVLLEALAAGLPVITTENCGYAHFVEDANAGMVLRNPFQQNEFNIAIQSMLLSPKRAEWSRNALSFSKQADIYSMPERAAEILEKLAKQ